jgi:hypothetical protein
MVKKELTEQRSRKLSLSDPSYKNDGVRKPILLIVTPGALHGGCVGCGMMLVQLHGNYIDDYVLCILRYCGSVGLCDQVRMLERKSLFNVRRATLGSSGFSQYTD